MSTPNLPHTENLVPLYELVFQLQGLVNESDALKDNISGLIDTLVVEVNEEPEVSRNQRLKQLKLKNQQLKEDLSNRINYTTAITDLINNYELSIQTILESVRNDVVDYNLKALEKNRENYEALSKKSQKEFELYEQLIKKRVLIFEVATKLKELIGLVDEKYLYESNNVKKMYELVTAKKILMDLSQRKYLNQEKSRKGGSAESAGEINS